jgi:hypothetical protein
MVMPLLFLIPLFLPLWQNSTCSRALWRTVILAAESVAERPGRLAGGAIATTASL